MPTSLHAALLGLALVSTAPAWSQTDAPAMDMHAMHPMTDMSQHTPAAQPATTEPAMTDMGSMPANRKMVLQSTAL